MAVPDWPSFATQHRFEPTVFALTNQSLAALARSPLRDEVFSAFAFNGSSFYGSLALSFDTDPAVRQTGSYPPDWRYEAMETEVPEVLALWREQYEPLRVAFEHARALPPNLSGQLQGQTETPASDVAQGFLHSLRRVLVQLERTQAFAQLRTTEPFWTLVTEVDADTAEEERLLEAVRKAGVG